ncbi:MAG: phosphoribosylaminoimidazolesuccinocarboxamide synthase [Tepidimonas sp.]|uniref:phosphoribosylaminoimidazolesuccinocarboxamide synthase n=1 Tax=Tepidimonas sp. TaxID=2002775 RepID=UPI00298F3DF6|nr:phosphoribosylaminoimidazolesuccinocarboxamide synthase [Tepidimonas sp.]MDW8335871.1 phosphoribosylaminoimidazolesuccinocarboxamide synthase [Tepidimonas sp.]
MSALHTSHLSSLPLLSRGKVRDNYAVGDDRILMVTTDRISAFDVVMGEPIPGKGELLTRLSLFWFERLGPQGANLCPIHLTGEDPVSVVAPEEREQVRGRSMLVKRLRPIPVEAVVRGYLAGSGWKEYQQSQSVCGVRLPPGLRNASRLPTPIFTPAAKAAVGEHDENITFDAMVARIGADLAERIRAVSIQLYQAASAYAATRGILIADTKFEFGLDADGTLTLMDEVLTPDSSRYWPAESYAEGNNPPSFDKQYLRDWLETAQVDGRPWNKQPPPPPLPPEVIEQTAARYREALARLLG